MAAFREDRPSWRASCPPSSPAHAIAWLLANPVPGISLVTLSGRGDKDLAEVLGE